MAGGHNSRKISPVMRQYGYRQCYVHAESDALLKLGKKRCAGKDLLVIRTGMYKLKNSKPCPQCMGMIKTAGIKNVYFSNKEGNIQKIKV